MAHGWCFLLLTLGVCGLSSSVPHQFHVVKVGKNWTEAQQYCREEFTDLATIDNMAELEKAKRVIQNENVANDWEAWIGLTYGNSPKWQWSLADEGSYGENETEFRNWDTDDNQPSGSDGEDCVCIHQGGKWHDCLCTDKRRFICYNETSSTHPYVLVGEKKNWADAQRYCREKHTDLASVRNQEENDKIYSDILRELGNKSYPWIGLFRDAWEWSGGSSSSFRHWALEEPNFGEAKQKFSARMKSSGLWNDVGKQHGANFICYEALPTVEVLSPHSPFYSGDEVTLNCKIPKYTGQFFWLKDGSPVPGKTSKTSHQTSQSISISLPEDVGRYQCHRRRDGSSVEPYVSTPVNITINDLPDATVEVVSPKSPFYSGDEVTLKCNVADYTDWDQYVWLKDNSILPGNQSNQIITITVEAGHYRCYGKREDRPMNSSESASVNITNYDKYVLVNEGKSWQEALEYCREHHVDLVSVSSEKIQRWVAGWAKEASTPNVWVGLRYSCNLGFWFWVSGEIICYDNWVSNQESDRGCTYKVGAVRKDGKWGSFEETEKFNFICTKEGQWN